MSGIYETARDIDALRRLVEEAVDEDSGEIKPMSAEDEAVLAEWMNETETAFEKKFDNICRYYRNLEHDAAVAEAERESLKEETQRLGRRVRTAENKAARLKAFIRFAFNTLGVSKYKTALFSAGVQKTQYTVKETSAFDVKNIPQKYLKQELSAALVKEGVKAGELYIKDDDPLARGVLFYKNENGIEERLKGVFYSQGDALVIR